MSWIFDNANRQPIPRCLDYVTACSLRLLRVIGKQGQTRKTEVQSSRARHEWQKSPNLATAIDLLGEALILKNFESDEARRAAHYVLSTATASSPLVRQLANHFLEKPSSVNVEPSLVTQIDFVRERVGRLKRWVRSHPINPIAWSDLSLGYATLGQVEKARLAMEVALSLGRSNRFILRSAARCFLHMEEPDRAIAILDRSGLCHFDPWIASAEIAISGCANLRSKCLGKAKHLVHDDNLTDFSRSELAAGIGTAEIRNGSARRARRLLTQAIVDPTENALAQAEWMATQLSTDKTSIVSLGPKVPASFEAQALYLYYKKQFRDSIKASERWGQYQPLSSRPIILSSFLASVCLDDDKEALRILNSTWPAQRNDPVLINNYVFSLARSGDLAAATQELRKVSFDVLSNRQRLLLTATRGLVAFRMQNIEQGQELYAKAVRGFELIDDLRSAAAATYFWAVEEKRIRSPDAASRVADAKNRITRSHVFDFEDLVKRL